ncbi:1258400c-e2fd-4b82-a97e-6920b85d39bb [Thermothielavioides terrestris]|uniref:1258400c-e2fd-4b82-a97e-6920b85d39bb n=1 Tax=Thermothielavioides terrestris TaxID=2587410 RepID=A0A3S4F7N5_9PEZI|nr:1258400c-e2fd-4b82-a97e-6920b85d39bb [Thermothielavioides terrestris]
MNRPLRTNEPQAGDGCHQSRPRFSNDPTTNQDNQDLNGISNISNAGAARSEEDPSKPDYGQPKPDPSAAAPSGGPEKAGTGTAGGVEVNASAAGVVPEVQHAGHEDTAPAAGVGGSPPRSWLGKVKHAIITFGRFVGPGFMVAVAYIDPGNYATDVAAGASYRFRLLFIVLLSNIFAIFLQSLAIKLGTVSGLNLAEACRAFLPRWLNYALYAVAEAAIIATDIAEVIGTAIALNLLIPQIPLVAGCALSILEVMVILVFYRPNGPMRGLRAFEYFVMVLVLAVVVCFCIQLSLIKNTSPGEVFRGYLPSSALIEQTALYQACGILGATVMPHSLYLGSGIVQSRLYEYDSKAGLLPPIPVESPAPSVFNDSSDSYRKEYIPSLAAIQHSLKYSVAEVAFSLFTFALFVNSAILIVAGASLYSTPGEDLEADLFGIHDLLSASLAPAAGTVFALALLFSGISAGIVCTIAGQMVSEGALHWTLRPWLRRLVTRSISIAPSIVIAAAVGRKGLDAALNGSQVALSISLPFVSAPLIYFTSVDRYMMVRPGMARFGGHLGSVSGESGRGVRPAQHDHDAGAQVAAGAEVEVEVVVAKVAAVVVASKAAASKAVDVAEASKAVAMVVAAVLDVDAVVLPSTLVLTGPGGQIPQPDEQVTELENRWIQNYGVQDKKSATSELESGMAALSVSEDIFPFRPQFGTRGIPVVLWANYFKLIPKIKTLHKYDVRVLSGKEEDASKGTRPAGKDDGPKEAKGKKLAKLIELALKKLPGNPTYATEFKQQVVSLAKLQLPGDSYVQVVLNEPPRKPETWFVRFDGPKSLSISGLMSYLEKLEDKANGSLFPKFPDEIDALGVLLGHTPRSNPNTSTGRLLLNVNVTAGVFRRAFKLDELFRDWELTGLNGKHNRHEAQLLTEKASRLHKFLARSRILYTVPGQSGTIERTIAGLAHVQDGSKPSKGDKEQRPQFENKGFPFGTPSTVRFFLRDPKTGAPPPAGLKFETMVTVAEYHKAKYGIDAKIGLPLINAGTAAKPTYILAEHCTLLPGQPMRSRLSPAEQDAMIQFACRVPPENAQSITTSGRELLALDSNPLLARFGISIDKNLITVKGRELAPPSVLYSRERSATPVTPQQGTWNMRGVHVAQKGRYINNWTFFDIENKDTQQDKVPAAVKAFGAFLADGMGIAINKQPNPPGGIRVSTTGAEDVRNAFNSLRKLKAQPQFVLVVLPRKDVLLYNMVKKLGDVELGLPTVCVRREMLTKEGDPRNYFTNVGLKINLKFGGVNHKVKDPTNSLFAETMFVGYDVTHPTNLAPGASASAPSIVGLVASIDANLAQWPAVTWKNESRVEQVGSDTDTLFTDNFKERLKLWREKNGRLPPNIVIFRDGVSEGQFRMVLEKELPHIRKACEVTYPPKSQPKITLIVSVKRHQTRFYPTDREHAAGKCKSPVQGTVVDRGVTNARYWDFYLQAHASIQGTARPAHYTVLLDEIFRQKFGSRAADVLEQLTHDMCYAYGRATRAVSICPPAYYADLVCTRARVHNSQLFEDSASATEGSETANAWKAVSKELANTMYYI